jgi:hypothetical protein
MRVREKRNLLGRRSIAGAVGAVLVAALLAIAAGAALGEEPPPFNFYLNKYTAAPGETLEYKLTQLEPGDAYTIVLGDHELASGVNGGGDTVGGEPDSNRVYLKIPDLGDSDRDPTIRATVTRDGVDPMVSDRLLHYRVPASPSGATTQQQGTPQPSTPNAPAGPARLGPTGGGKTSPKSPKGTTGTPKQKAKKKSGSNADDSPSYVAPTVGTPSASGGSAGGSHTPLPSAPFSSSSDLPSAPSLPAPASTPPPGIAGSGGAVGTPPPLAVAPVADKGGDDGNKLDVPIWLIVLLGALMFGGLGGAEARLLGLWGTPLLTARSPDEARLVALTRAAQASAGTQQAIAARKGTMPGGAAVKAPGGNGASAEDPRRLQV